MVSLFSKKKQKKTHDSTILDSFPELNQGQQYLQRRRKVEQAMKNNLELIESFTLWGTPTPTPTPAPAPAPSPAPSPAVLARERIDYAYKTGCPGDGSFSTCGNIAGCPNYGYCSPKPPPPIQENGTNTNTNEINSLVAQQQGLYKNYIAKVSAYIATPPTGLKGRNVYVPQLTGAAQGGGTSTN